VRIIAIINQKGGCGKTTTAINLAGITARKGLRTILVDLDPQSHCAAGLAIPEQRIDLDIGDAMLAAADHPVDPSRLLWRASRNLDLAPSRMKLAGLEAARGGLAVLPDKERRLSLVLSHLKGYDVCFIDCSPSIGLLTFNALAAATDILIPVETSFFSLQGATKQVNTIKSLSKRLGVATPYWLVATLHEDASVLSRDLLQELRRRFGARVAPEFIRRDAILKEAASFGQPAIEYSPTSNGAKDYSALAEWLLRQVGSPQTGSGRAEDDADEATIHPAVESIGIAAEPKPAPSPAPVSHAPGVPTSGVSAPSAVRPSPAEVALAAASADPESAAVSRAEDLAQRARMLLLKRADEQLKKIAPATRPGIVAAGPAPASIPEPATILPATPLVMIQETKPLKPDANAAAIRGLYGARTTRAGVLFVQPLTLGNWVNIAGDFNRWSGTATPMKRNESLGVFEACVPLPPGRHPYRLIVDGKWTVDPYNDESGPNPFGELNSIITVPAEASESGAVRHPGSGSPSVVPSTAQHSGANAPVPAPRAAAAPHGAPLPVTESPI
jgi:chromosome partitioning protein